MRFVLNYKNRFARALWENPDTLAKVEATAPLKRIGKTDEVAGAAIMLAFLQRFYYWSKNCYGWWYNYIRLN